jgi:hypothetical protein
MPCEDLFMESNFLTEEDRKVFDELEAAGRELVLEDAVFQILENSEVPQDIYGDFDMSRPIGLTLYSSQDAGAE